MPLIIFHYIMHEVIIRAVCFLILLLHVYIPINAQQEYLPVLNTLKARGYKFDTIKHVNNFPGFITALNNNTVIILDTGNYFVGITPEMRQHPVESTDFQPWDSLSRFYSKQTVHDLNNLIIIGIGISPSAFLQPLNNKEVLRYRNIENLYITN